MTAVGAVDREKIEAVEQAKRLDEATLLGMVEPDPVRPGVERGKLVGYGIPVWGIIAHLQALTGADVEGDVDPVGIAEAAIDYRIPVEAVVAAIAYYQRHRALIDGLFARNAAAAERAIGPPAASA
jgi:uncharacterized protein (DUF433 family)